MREVRIPFSAEEYAKLKNQSNQLGVTLKLLIHNRAISTADSNPLYLAKILSDEIAVCRRSINRIIQRETRSEFGLYEADIIRLEMAMCELEGIVASFISELLR